MLFQIGWDPVTLIRGQFPVVSCPFCTAKDQHQTATMSRLYTLFSCLTFLIFIPSLISAHLIEVPAGKKECFFEDLHVHDKVRVLCWPRSAWTDANISQMTVTYQVGEGGHLDIDFWVSRIQVPHVWHATHQSFSCKTRQERC